MNGLSGHRLNVNHFTKPLNSETNIMQICSSCPYPIGPSLPQQLQEPWAALAVTGAITSIAPASLTSLTPITQHSGQLVSEWWRDQGSRPKEGHVLHSQDCHEHHKVEFSSIFQSGKAYLRQQSQRAVLHYFRNHYYSSGLATQGFLKGSLLEW